MALQNRKTQSVLKVEVLRYLGDTIKYQDSGTMLSKLESWSPVILPKIGPYFRMDSMVVIKAQKIT